MSPLQKIQDLWLDEAYIRIQVEDHECKVPAQILQRHSEFFRGLLASSEEVKQETLRLPEKVKDFEPFMKAMIYSDYFEAPPYKTELDTLIAILRLSDKYMVPHLRQRALLHLEQSFPINLTAWNNRATQETIMPSRGGMGPQTSLEFAASLLDLVNTVQARWLLPGLLHDLCGAQTRDIVTVSSLLDKQSKSNIYGWYSSQIRAWEEAVGATIVADMPNCNNPIQCNAIKLHSYSLVTSQMVVNGPKPLNIWGDYSINHFASTLCHSCRDLVDVNYEVALQQSWVNLPDLYDLPGWDILYKEREQELRM